MFKYLVKKNRSYRKFDESGTIEEDVLLELIDTARMCPASVNIQPLKYYYCNDDKTRETIFPLTAWARSLPEFKGPPEGARPMAYIIICTDKGIAPNVERFAVDVGIAAQTIMLAAVEKGFGGCMIGNYSKELVSAALDLPERMEPSLILALGRPGEEVVLEEVPAGGKTTYYRDENNVHHVPKRPLSEVAVPL